MNDAEFMFLVAGLIIGYCLHELWERYFGIKLLTIKGRGSDPSCAKVGCEETKNISFPLLKVWESGGRAKNKRSFCAQVHTPICKKHRQHFIDNAAREVMTKTVKESFPGGEIILDFDTLEVEWKSVGE